MIKESRLGIVSEKFIEGISFELRTLLNGFAGPLQLMKFKIDDPAMFEVFRMFDTSISKMQRLAVRSSIVSAFEQNVHFTKESVDIVEVARYAALDMQSLADLENISLNIESETENSSVLGNYDLLLQVFQVILELITSLSTENTHIFVDFKTINEGVLCKISSPTANLPTEIFTNKISSKIEENVSWDIELVKKIIIFHKAMIRMVESNGLCNELQIFFEK